MDHVCTPRKNVRREHGAVIYLPSTDQRSPDVMVLVVVLEPIEGEQDAQTPNQRGEVLTGGNNHEC